MKKVMLIFGTRPEAIKMCPLVNELKTRKGIETIVCVTGQHRQMLDQVLEAFQVEPDYDLSIMKDRQTLFDVTTNILNRIKAVLEEEQPDTYVGMPTALLSMLRMCGKGSIKRALVSGDACPKTVMKAIEEILQTRLWPHYGSREMGLGGAICCAAHDGMHMRENHCITEIIDENGNVLPDGEWGELVITTIGMEAQPLIRYRTGDWTRIIPGRCLCGSEIKRLDFVKRMDPLGSIREMDELLFEIPELVDYCVKIVDGKKKITALFTSDNGEERIRSVLEEKDIRSWNCRKVKWEDLALYPGKRVTRQ